MIDIHSHILPGIDDGARNLEESIEMARGYIQCGFSAVIATPHIKEGRYNYGKDRIFRETENLNVELALAGMDLDVYTGAEYFLDIRVVKDCENNEILTLGKSGYVLIEFPLYHMPKYAENVLTFLLKNGFIPVLAHPERCIPFQKHGYEEAARFFKNGCKIQVDVQSLLGNHGKEAMKTAWSLMKEDLIDIISMDAHRPGPFSEHLTELSSMMPEEKKNTFEQLCNIDRAFIQKSGMIH